MCSKEEVCIKTGSAGAHFCKEIPGRLVNTMLGQKTSSLSGRYLCALKPFNVPVNTAAQKLPQSDFLRRNLAEIKAVVSAD